MRFPALFAFLIAVTMTPVLPARAAGSTAAIKDLLTPHKALYNIEMVSKRSGSQIVNISGQMFYEWKPGCEAWMTDHRFNLNYEYADSPPIRVTSDFSTYETFNGKSFDFTSRRKRNGELYQEIRGRAELDDESAGEAVYSMPDGLSFSLDRGTMFPLAHSLEVLERARKGDKFFQAVIFDGSDEEGPIEVSAFIGKEFKALPVTDRPAVDETLLTSPAWKVRMAFFPLMEQAADAEYEMDVVFHENGIISDMMVEYKDFSVTQKLAALEKIASEKCDKAKNP